MTTLEREWEVEGLAILSPGPKETELNTPMFIKTKKNDYNDTFVSADEESEITLNSMKEVIDSISLMDDDLIIQLNSLIQFYNTDSLIIKELTMKKRKHTVGVLGVMERLQFMQNIREFTGFKESVVVNLENLMDIVTWTFLKKMMKVLRLTSRKYIKTSMLIQIINKLKYPLKRYDTNYIQIKQISNTNNKVEAVISPFTTPHSLYDKYSVVNTKNDTSMHLSFDHNCFATPSLHTVLQFDGTDEDLLYAMIG